MSGDNSRHRLGLLAVCALSLFGALFARLWFLQVVQADAFEDQVARNSTRTVVTPAPRGRILDRNGMVLVDNRESIVVAVDAQKLKDLPKAEQKAVLTRLATALSRWKPPNEAITVDFINKRLNNERFSRYRPVPIVEDIGVEQEIYLREQADRFPAVVVERQTVRKYPYGALAAHVIGYVGAISPEELKARAGEKAKPYEKSDEIGKAGVERTYEPELRGRPGKRVYEVNRNNRVVREITNRRVDPVPGDDLYLSIDARLQYKTEEALQAQILDSKTKTPTGAATVLDPRNGQVLAMASYPTYDPRDLVGGLSEDLLHDPAKPMANRNIQEAYPAASTFKLATSFAGLRLGIIEPNAYVRDTGVYVLCQNNQPACRKKNSGNAVHGSINLSEALTVSSDYYYYRIGDLAWKDRERLGDDALQQEIQRLGYGEKSGIDLNAETAGRVPTPKSQKELADSIWNRSHANYKSEADYHDAQRWKAGYSADVAIGQYDTLVTPLQTANAYASLANAQSDLYRPSVMDRITASRQPDKVHRRFVKHKIRTVEYGESKNALLAGFQGAVQSRNPRGTAYKVFSTFPLSSFPVSGKTGTAQVGTKEQNKADNSLFVGFGPNPDNQYVVSVMIQGGGFGAWAAAPAAYMVLDPVADGSLERFEVPLGGAIDPEAALARYKGIDKSGSD